MCIYVHAIIGRRACTCYSCHYRLAAAASSHLSVHVPSHSSLAQQYAPLCSHEYPSTAARWPRYLLTCTALAMGLRAGRSPLIPMTASYCAVCVPCWPCFQLKPTQQARSTLTTPATAATLTCCQRRLLKASQQTTSNSEQMQSAVWRLVLVPRLYVFQICLRVIRSVQAAIGPTKTFSFNYSIYNDSCKTD
jgi:hypothetical protein